MNFQTMSKQRKFILIAAAVGVISVFLPWITISAGVFGMNMDQSINGFHGLGMVVFLSFAGAIVLSLVGDQTKSLEKSFWLLALIAGSLALLVILISFVNGRSGGFGVVDTGYGIGIWIALLSAIGVVGSAWMFKNPADTLKDGFDSIKQSMATPPAAPTGSVTPTAPPAPPSGTSKIAELEKLVELKNQGNISEEEFQQLKSKLL